MKNKAKIVFYLEITKWNETERGQSIAKFMQVVMVKPSTPCDVNTRRNSRFSRLERIHPLHPHAEGTISETNAKASSNTSRLTRSRSSRSCTRLVMSRKHKQLFKHLGIVLNPKKRLQGRNRPLFVEKRVHSLESQYPKGMKRVFSRKTIFKETMSHLNE